MLPTVDSRVFAIEGGNRLLPEALLKNASVVMLSGAEVTSISKDGNGLFHVGLGKSSQVSLRHNAYNNARPHMDHRPCSPFQACHLGIYATGWGCPLYEHMQMQPLTAG